jgi:hypothetical protein
MKSRRKFLTGVGVTAASLVVADSAHGFGRRSRCGGDAACGEPTDCNYRRRRCRFLCILCIEGCALYIHGQRYNARKEPYELCVWHWLDEDEKEPMWACELPWDSHVIVKSPTHKEGKCFIGHDFTVQGPNAEKVAKENQKAMKEGLDTVCEGISVYCCSRYGQRPQEDLCCKPWHACCITCGDQRVCVQSGSCVQCGGVCIPCQ